jgi:hypothetical protein
LHCGKNLPEINREQRAPFSQKALLEQKFHLFARRKQKFHLLDSQQGTKGGAMTTLQAICFGAMLAWTPSLVVLAVLLHAFPLGELQHDPS